MTAERNEVSIQEVKFYKAASTTWATSKELASRAGGNERSARAYAVKFVRLGIFDQAEVFPAHRYRISEKAAKRNISYVQRLEDAAEVFGLK